MIDNLYFDEEYIEEQMEEPDEHQLRLMQISNCLSCFAGADFETALENACYMCGVDVEEFDEWDLQDLEDAYK